VADNLPNTIENQLLDALVGTSAYTVTTPIKLALMTANGSDSAPGTEVTGGSYARQTITFGAASSGSISNGSAVTFTGMPACTVVGIEIYDSAGTPKRLAYGPLTNSRTVSAGDSVEFATSSVTLSLS
jgi:hypothetical protein